MLTSLKKTMLVISLMYITLGVLIIVNSEDNGVLVMNIMSFGLLIAGILSMIKYFKRNVKERYKGNDFIVGGLLLSLSFIIYLTKAEFSLKILSMAIVISGLHKFQDLFDLKAVGVDQQSIYLFGFFVCTIIGLLLIFDVIKQGRFYIVMLGLGLCVSGISDLVSNFYVSSCVYKHINEKKRSGGASSN